MHLAPPSSGLLMSRQNSLSTCQDTQFYSDLFNLANALTLVSADIQDKLLILFSKAKDVLIIFSALALASAGNFSLRIIFLKLHQPFH
jgi:hypothetical protein